MSADWAKKNAAGRVRTCDFCFVHVTRSMPEHDCEVMGKQRHEPLAHYRLFVESHVLESNISPRLLNGRISFWGSDGEACMQETVNRGQKCPHRCDSARLPVCMGVIGYRPIVRMDDVPRGKVQNLIHPTEIGYQGL